MKAYYVVTTQGDLRVKGNLQYNKKERIYIFKHQDGSILTVNKQYMVSMLEYAKESDAER